MPTGTADVTINLQAMLTTMYDWYGFDLELNYGRPPPLPPSPADAAWAADLLASRDRR